jgi:putative acetyltransferase
MVNVIHARSCADITRIQQLFFDLSPCLDFIALFQGIQIDLADIPNSCIQPNGCLHIAETGAHIVGCSFVKRINEDVCELNRLFVLPGFRRLGIGTMLVRAALTEAELLGYHLMQLETLASMKDAIAIYQGLGFHMIPQELRGRTTKMLQMVLILGDIAHSA